MTKAVCKFCLKYCRIGSMDKWIDDSMDGMNSLWMDSMLMDK